MKKMGNTILVTIAIPAYKSNYLADAIKSAIQQSYTNVEIIIVNDKSPNDITSIVKTFDDKRIRYYENEVNIGGNDLVAQWNKCLSYAKGEYFCLLCDDDIYAPTFVEEMLSLAKKYPNCNVFRGRAVIIDREGIKTTKYPISPEHENLDSYIWNVSHFRRKQTVSEFMLNTEHIRKVGGYYSIPLAWGADYVSTYRFAEEGGIASSPKELVFFRMSGENISSEHEKNFLCKLDALNKKNEATKTIIQRGHYPNEKSLLSANGIYLKKQQGVHIATTTYHNIFKLIPVRKNYHVTLWQIVRSLILKVIGRYKK